VNSSIRLTVNGVPHNVDADPDESLLDVLRERLALRGTRFGCGAGECGACFVLVDGRAMASCNLPVSSVADRQVITVEGDLPLALREAFVAEQAAQCGYCVSGILISATALLQRTPQPDEAAVRAALDANLCRCGAHNRIVRAVLRAAAAGDRQTTLASE
jgi:nicotinate dehydrogenase subunit A